jgi:acyl CoA:acetate/3-ketoacid CoA transferase
LGHCSRAFGINGYILFIVTSFQSFTVADLGLYQIAFAGHMIGRGKCLQKQRGVFNLEDQKLILTEIAPGVDLERDILGMMEFKPMVSPDLKLMDPDMFQPTWGKLETILQS